MEDIQDPQQQSPLVQTPQVPSENSLQNSSSVNSSSTDNSSSQTIADTAILPSPTPSSSKPSAGSSMKWVYGSLAVLLIVGLSFTVLTLMQKTNMHQNAMGIKQRLQTLGQPTVIPTSVIQPTPVISPITSSNVDQTLNTTDSTVQQSIDQANSDLDKVNNIDQTQDSTNGL